MSKFESIVEEQLSTIKRTQTMRFPRQINFSEEFLESIEKEYYTQIISESPEAPVKNRPKKFIKALEFVVADLVANEDEKKGKYNTLSEDTEEYTAGCESKPATKKMGDTKKEKKVKDDVYIYI